MESEFFFINEEVGWKDGVYKNIEVNKGLKILKEYKLSISQKIKLSVTTEDIGILDYASNGYGVIYYLDNSKDLWHYDYVNDEKTKLYKINIGGEICLFQVIANKLYILTVENNNYKLKVYYLPYEKLLKEIKVCSGKLLAYGINKHGDIFMLGEDKKVLCLQVENGEINTINNDELFIITEEQNGVSSAFYTKDYKDVQFLKKFDLNISKFKTDIYGNFYLLDNDNILSILKKELKLKEFDNSSEYIGVYYSKIFDSQKTDMKWNKIVMESSIPQDTQIKINYYTFNASEIQATSFEEKEQYFNKLQSNEIINPKEALFQEAKGRYMVLRLELKGREAYTPLVSKLKVYYNRSSYLKYLPEIYGSDIETDDFLERYLSIFEVFYMSIEEKIDYISNYFDVDKTSSEFLKWLCDWMGMSEYKNWSDDKLRKLLKRASFLNKKKGTKKAIEEILEIYLGVKPIIIEAFQFDEIKSENIEFKKVIENLYGDNFFSYTVLINIKKDLSLEEINSVNQILMLESPAYCKYQVIILKPWIFLDKQSYLGVNSVVSGYLPLKLDGKAVLPFNSVLVEEYTNS